MTEPADTLPLARKIAALAEERRATDLVLLDVRGLVDYTDYFLLATGQSARQNQAIAEHVVKTLKGEKRYAISKAGLDTGRWICIDLTDVVFHVFDAETRARYDLELLWADAPRVDLTTPVAPAAPEAAPEKKPSRRKRAVRQEAIVDADADNAPDEARPANPDEPEPEAPQKPLPSRRRAWAEAAAAKAAAEAAERGETVEAAPEGDPPTAAPTATPTEPTDDAPAPRAARAPKAAKAATGKAASKPAAKAPEKAASKAAQKSSAKAPAKTPAPKAPAPKAPAPKAAPKRKPTKGG